MEQYINEFVKSIPHTIWGAIVLFLIILAALYVLGKGADILVDQAVLLSLRWGVPKMLVGATVVSLGTTLPEVSVSVMAAIRGFPGLSMGNAVGSIICDTGLILGLAALLRPLPYKKAEIRVQGWIQLGAGVLLVIVSILGGGGVHVFSKGGHIPQFMGFVFLGLLVLYVLYTILGAQKKLSTTEESKSENANEQSAILILLKMIVGVVMVILASQVLIPTVQEVAIRFHIPETIIAATLVAFGTSLPELITALTAARKGHGELAIGNVIGADILNVLFVLGASIAVTPGGLAVHVDFFRLLFPTMLFILLVFKGSVLFSKEILGRGIGIILLLSYIFVTVLSYFLH